MNDIDDVLTFCRGLSIDHEPDGWPAIRMRDITALADEIERLRKDAERYRWLRNEDNWGADDGFWEVLGESHSGVFDDMVDYMMEAPRREE